MTLCPPPGPAPSPACRARARLAVVTATGSATQIGLIQRGVQQAKQDERRTPLAMKLDSFSEKLTLAIGGIAYR